MIAVDTNLLVRYVTNDDPVQARQALAVLAGEEAVFVSRTVILELEWVLRAAYKLPPEAIEGALLTLLGLPSVVPEQPAQLALALGGLLRGNVAVISNWRRRALLDGGEVAALGRFCHPGVDGVQVRVGHAGEDRGVIQQGLGFEAPFPEASGAVVQSFGTGC